MLVIIFSFLNLNASEAVQSDPDHISTGFEYRGVPDVRLGDVFSSDYLSFGAMAEIRNESRFNQKILPNHNWRGFAFIYLEDFTDFDRKMFGLTAGFEHESAHPTMGLNDGNKNAYDKIYDGTYRNINLNSFMLRLSGTPADADNLTFNLDAQFYFYSRNTPELPVNKLTWSEGISGGIEYRSGLFKDTVFFIALFDRYIFRSRKNVYGNIYYNTASGVELRNVEYPVINSMNTFSVKSGLIFDNLLHDRKVSIYCGVLYGNISGFVDSRENRTVYSAGIEITQ